METAGVKAQKAAWLTFKPLSCFCCLEAQGSFSEGCVHSHFLDVHCPIIDFVQGLPSSQKSWLTYVQGPVSGLSVARRFHSLRNRNVFVCMFVLLKIDSSLMQHIPSNFPSLHSSHSPQLLLPQDHPLFFVLSSEKRQQPIRIKQDTVGRTRQKSQKYTWSHG